MVSFKKHVNVSQLRLLGQIAASNFVCPARPYKVTFALTYRCNFRCGHCRTWTREEKKELTGDQIRSILNSAPWLRWLHLTGGEIFLREDIEEILGFLAEERSPAVVTFATNGFLTEKIFKTLVVLKDHFQKTRWVVTCSLDGIPEVHNRLRGIPEAYERCLETFTRLRTIKGLSPYLGVTVSRENLEGLSTLLSCVKKRIPDFHFGEMHFNFAQESFFYNNRGVFPSSATTTRKAYEAVQTLRQKNRSGKTTWKHWLENKYFELMPRFLENNQSPLRCTALNGSCFIDPYGNVYPCTGFEAKLGNLSETDLDLKRFWEAYKHKKKILKQSIKKHQCPGCWTACEAYPSILSGFFQRPR
jgi:radical SAM protein with 4Fe4S-binding SPASM domain